MADQQPNEDQIAGALVKRLMSGKRRGQFLQMVKEEVPQVPIPEIDAAKPVLDALAQRDAQIAALTTELRNDRLDRQIAKSFDELQRERGYLDPAITGIKELMVKEGIRNPTVAADVWDKRNADTAQPAVPTSPWMSPAVNIATANDYAKEWFKDSDKMFDLEVGNVFTESRAGKLSY